MIGVLDTKLAVPRVLKVRHVGVLLVEEPKTIRIVHSSPDLSILIQKSQPDW